MNFVSAGPEFDSVHAEKICKPHTGERYCLTSDELLHIFLKPLYKTDDLNKGRKLNRLERIRMQFIVTGYDGTDENALKRRMAAREDHLAMAKEMADSGCWLFAAAMLNDDQKMVGSVIVCEFESKQALKTQWLDKEPYVLGRVWERVEITPAAVPPLFLK